MGFYMDTAPLVARNASSGYSISYRVRCSIPLSIAATTSVILRFGSVVSLIFFPYAISLTHPRRKKSVVGEWGVISSERGGRGTILIYRPETSDRRTDGHADPARRFTVSLKNDGHSVVAQSLKKSI